jgi:prevent-host-death family protein
MATLTVAEAKNRFSDVLRRAEYGGERVIVARHGKPVAAIVSTDDLRRLEAAEEAAEDAADLRDAQQALTEAKQEGTIPLETVLRKYGLDHLLAVSPVRTTRPPRTPRSRVSTKRSRKASANRARR